jgi:hypothetical protein
MKKHDVGGLVEIPFIDIVGGNEIINFNSVRTLEFHSFELLFVDLGVSASRELISPCPCILCRRRDQVCSSTICCFSRWPVLVLI